MKGTFVRIPFVYAGGPVVLAGILFLASGCAALSDGLSPDIGPALTSLDSPSITTTGADLIALDQPPVAAAELEGAKAADAPPKDAADELYDPFAKEEETLGAGEDYDPWEGFNSAMFTFNRRVDKYALKPFAKVYDTIMPNALQKGISNFYYNNIHFGPRLLNNIFQVKFKGAGIEISRLLINNIIGLAGFFDPAKHWFGLETPKEDTGQTLGAYGVPPGPYLVLPLLPPLTLRDLVGYIMDFCLNPVNYFLLPTFEVDGWPSAIAHYNRDTTTILQVTRTVEELVNERSINLETFEGVEEATVDLYSAVRNAYLQKRAKMVRE
ncbi:MAG: VacJ family lipoprotein [Nitrospiraceae bacterium]|nr:VacJ family lipoprotein [Nitrospiraceae bacterium]